MNIPSQMNIHPTSIIHHSAIVAEDVSIGPFCTVGAHVVIGRGCRLVSHVVLEGHTTLGEGNIVHPFSAIGTPPQDMKYAGEDTRLTIGNHNVFREHVTVNTGTVQDDAHTRIGNQNLFLTGSHVAHDCLLEDNIVLTNGATLAGHVKIGNGARIGGLSAVHQFTRIGAHAIVGGMSGVERDVPPFSTATGNRAVLGGLNLVGLRRSGIENAHIRVLQDVFEATLREKSNGTITERATDMAAAYPDVPIVQTFCAFISLKSKRGICTAGA